MFAAMNARFNQLTATRACDEGESSHCQNQSIGGRSSGNERPYHEESSMKYLLKLVKLDFSRFDGSKDPASQISQADQFFEVHQTLEEEKLLLWTQQKVSELSPSYMVQEP